MAMFCLPPAIMAPAIEESRGVEIYAEGCLFHVGAHTIESVLYRSSTEAGGAPFRECGRIIMPKPGFDEAVLRAYAQRMIGLRH